MYVFASPIGAIATEGRACPVGDLEGVSLKVGSMVSACFNCAQKQPLLGHKLCLLRHWRSSTSVERA